MYVVYFTNQFKKDLKKIKKQGKDLSLINDVKNILEEKGTLPSKYKEHALKGNYLNKRECHILPDWLLIWNKDTKNKTITLERTGSHSNLFTK